MSGVHELQIGVSTPGLFCGEANLENMRFFLFRSAVNLTNATAEVELVVRNNRGRAVRHTMRCVESEIG